MATQLDEVVEEGNDTMAGGDTGLDLTEHVFGSGAEGGDDSHEDDAMMAGYEQVTTGEFKEVKATDDANDTQAGGDAAPKPTSSPTPSPAPAPVKVGRWTEDEIEQHFGTLSAVKKTTDSLAGVVGSLKQRLEKAGTPRQFTKEDFPTIQGEYGDEFTNAFVADMNKAGLGGQVAGISQDEVNRLVGETVAAQSQEIEQRIEYKAVKRRHPDADEYFTRRDAEGKPVVGAKAVKFLEWIATLPQPRQQEICASWDRDTVSGAIAEFKKAGAPPAAAPAATPAPAPASQSRQERLKKAVTPPSSGSGIGAPVEDAFESGYKAAKRGG